jgi:hypothetical protein
MLPEITARIRVPRALEVPFPLGYPLGLPNQPEMQREILRALLGLLESEAVPVVGKFADNSI